MNPLSIVHNIRGHLLKPGDRVFTYVSKKGNSVISKIDTERWHATYREYYKKNGTPGKRTLTLRES